MTTALVPDAPTTLRDVADALDDHRSAILARRADLADFQREVEADVAGHQNAVRDLVARQVALMQEAFGDLVPVSPARPRRDRAGGATADYAARTATRMRTLARHAAIRKFAAEKGLECPATGGAFSDELRAAFDAEAGYQG